MLNSIKTWLANPKRKYSDGVSLYLKTRNGNTFDSFFQSVKEAEPGSNHFNMLTDRLQKIARILETNSRVQSESVSAIKVDIKKAAPINVAPITIGKNANKQMPSIDANPYIRIEDLPENLQADFREIQKLTPEIHTWHEKAKAANSDNERKETINNAAMLEERRDELWFNIDSWWLENKAEGMDETLKSELVAKVEAFKVKHSNAGNAAKEAIELNDRISDLVTNINRAKKELPKLKDNKLTNRKKSIAGWEKELTEKQARLKEITEVK